MSPEISPKDRFITVYGRNPVREVLLDRLGGLGVPVLGEVGFGHCAPSWTVPLGVPAVLDAGAGTLEFEVPALR